MDNHALQLKERSTGLIATLTNPDASREFERNLTIQIVIQRGIPMSELRRIVGAKQVAIALDVQLTKLVANLNLKWTLSDSQIKTLVEDLLDKYPNESIEDFILCFKKARQGEYGELIRLDSPIVFSWMANYLDEKYRVLEDNLLKEKDEYYKTILPDNNLVLDKLQEWQDSISQTEGFKTVSKLSPEEIEKEGQEKPAKKVYPYNESEAQIRLREHHDKVFQFQEMTIRERHPEYSEEQIKSELDRMKATILYEESRPKHTFGIAKIWEAKKKKKTA